MIAVLSAQEAARIDSYIINTAEACSGLLMMENAASSVAKVVVDNLEKGSSVLILCGVGNNGGDGFAAARHLCNDFHCTIYYFGDKAKMSEHTALNFKFVENSIIGIVHIESESQLESLDFDYDCVVDAMIGVGGSESLRGLVVPILTKIDATQALKIAVDLPTGLNATTGKYHKSTFRADHTVTMLGLKRAFLNKRLAMFLGEIHISNLGVNPAIYSDEISEWLVEKSNHLFCLNSRPSDSSKHDYGRIAIIAGSRQYPGAAAIASNAAVASGGGLVHLFTTSVHHALFPEVIPHILSQNADGGIDSTNLAYILDQTNGFDAIAIGPGIGNSDDTLALVKELLANISDSTKIILDADALRILNDDTKFFGEVIITPHHGEFARILGISVEELVENRVDLARDFAFKSECTILLKGSPTIVTSGAEIYYSNTGNAGLASGGTGDALTGIVSALVAMAMLPEDAVAFAAFIHGLAADLYVADNSEESLRASELIKYIGKAIRLAKNEN